jgi:glycosyltransferase involved in cell wall biosynthesis
LLEHNVNAWLFDPDSKNAFMDGLNVLVQDAELRKRLSAAAKQSVLDRELTWDGNARQIIAIYEAL